MLTGQVMKCVGRTVVVGWRAAAAASTGDVSTGGIVKHPKIVGIVIGMHWRFNVGRQNTFKVGMWIVGIAAFASAAAGAAVLSPS